MPDADVVVIGGGVMGSAAAWALASRGRDVVLFEQHALGHDLGSSHGGARIFRFAYPDPFYVDLAQRSLELWRALEAEVGDELVEQVGGVDHGHEPTVRAVAAALEAAGRPFELLAPEAASARWPGLRFDSIVCASPDTGRVNAARALVALQSAARTFGAELRDHVGAEAIEPFADRVRVHTAGGERVDARVAVVAAGAWVEPLLSPAGVALPPLIVTEEQVFHFAPRSDAASEWPSFIHYRPEIAAYGMLTPGEGVKVGEHHAGRRIADGRARTGVVDVAGRERVVRYVAEWIPGVIPEAVTETTCLYTTTPNEDFVVDRHGAVVVASPCSGHGFKFAPLIGELVADLCLGARPLPRFALPR